MSPKHSFKNVSDFLLLFNTEWIGTGCCSKEVQFGWLKPRNTSSPSSMWGKSSTKASERLFVKLPAAACWYLMVRFCCTNISLSSYDTLSGSPCLHMVIFSQGWQSFYVSLWPHNNWLHLKPPGFSGRRTRVTTYLRIENILAHSSLPSHLQNFMVSWHKKYPYPTVSISSNYYLDNINIITNMESLKYCFKI